MTSRYLPATLACVVALAGCDNEGTPGDTGTQDDAVPDADPVNGCVTDTDCAMGVAYTAASDCGEAYVFNAQHIAREACITALGEVPGASCETCIEDLDAPRQGRLVPGQQWIVGCGAGTCTAAAGPCPVGECDPVASCSTSLDCFLGYTCDAGACTSGCDTGMDCRPGQVCVREPADARLGRCVST